MFVSIQGKTRKKRIAFIILAIAACYGLILDLFIRFRSDAARIRPRLEPNQVELWDNAMMNLQRELAI